MECLLQSEHDQKAPGAHGSPLLHSTALVHHPSALLFAAAAPAAVETPHLGHHADSFLLRREGVLGQSICCVQHQGVDGLVTQAAAAVQPVLPPADIDSSGMTRLVSCQPRNFEAAALLRVDESGRLD